MLEPVNAQMIFRDGESDSVKVDEEHTYPDVIFHLEPNQRLFECRQLNLQVGYPTLSYVYLRRIPGIFPFLRCFGSGKHICHDQHNSDQLIKKRSGTCRRHYSGLIE